MFKINEEDIRTHATALNHAVETELRFKGTAQLFSKNRKERFVHSQDKIIEVVKKYNPQTNAYIGNNERWIGGSHIIEVKTINSQYFDYESLEHKKNGKNFALQLAETDRKELKKQNINLALSDSGNGIHGGIFLSEPIPIECPEETNNISLIQARDYIKRIKSWAKNQQNEKANSDPVPHNLACMEKIIGSYSHSADATTFWMDKPIKTKTEDWLAWVNKMPKEEIVTNEITNFTTEERIPNDCKFMKWILKNNLPQRKDIERYHYCSPSVSAYTRNLKNKAEIRLEWEQLQDSKGSYIGSLACWDAIPSKFNCCALRRWGRVAGITKFCEECIEELM